MLVDHVQQEVDANGWTGQVVWCGAGEHLHVPSQAPLWEPPGGCVETLRTFRLADLQATGRLGLQAGLLARDCRSRSGDRHLLLYLAPYRRRRRRTCGGGDGRTRLLWQRWAVLLRTAGRGGPRVILSTVRDPRLITVRQGGGLTDQRPPAARPVGGRVRRARPAALRGRRTRRPQTPWGCDREPPARGCVARSTMTQCRGFWRPTPMAAARPPFRAARFAAYAAGHAACACRTSPSTTSGRRPTRSGR